MNLIYEMNLINILLRTQVGLSGKDTKSLIKWLFDNVKKNYETYQAKLKASQSKLMPSYRRHPNQIKAKTKVRTPKKH